MPDSGLSTATLKQAVTAAAVSAVQIDLFATAVTAQTAFNIDGLTGLDTDLVLAQKHANYWTSTLTQELKNSFGDVIDFGTTFTTYYTQLSALATKLATDPNAKTSFLDGLRDLRNQIHKRLIPHGDDPTQVVGIYVLLTNCQSFQADLGKDYEAFKSDSDELSALILATPDIQEQIDAITSQRRAAIASVTVDVLSVVGGVILIVVGAVATIATEGLAAGLIIAGATLLTTGALTLIPSSIQLAGLDKQYGDLLAKQGEQSAERAALTHTQTIVSDFVTKASEAQQAVSNIIAGWQQISEGIDQVIADLNDAKDDALAALYNQLPTDLDTAHDDWTSLVAYTTALQTRTKLNVTTAKPA